MKRLIPMHFGLLAVLGWLLLAAATACAQVDAAPRPAAISGLQAALARYEAIAASGGWTSVPGGPTIEPGSSGPRVAAVAERLAETGDLDVRYAGARIYDGPLQAAVRRFQYRHGLQSDALVGRRTLAAMNVPADARAAQLRLNLERAEALYASAPGRFLLINIPAFEAYLVDGGAKIWTTKVIVGETENETPMLEEEIEYVVLNPTWTVPRSIATEELLQKIQADPGFLTRGGYDVVDEGGSTVDPASVDWLALDVNDFPYVLVQRAGPVNELGRVKFMFPNAYGVCMHDTSSPYLFDYAKRAFSHGCIRMDRPVDFAERLLEPLGWTREAIDRQLETGETKTIMLDEPLAVFVTYMTASVDASGRVRFHGDLYDREAIRRNPDSGAAPESLGSKE